MSGEGADLGVGGEFGTVVEQVQGNVGRIDEIGVGGVARGDVACAGGGREALQQVRLAGAGITPQIGEMLARGALRKLVHQVRQLGIGPHLERIEAARRLGAEIEHQLFHGACLIRGKSCASGIIEGDARPGGALFSVERDPV
jgi:hypothetical protein